MIIEQSENGMHRGEKAVRSDVMFIQLGKGLVIIKSHASREQLKKDSATLGGWGLYSSCSSAECHIAMISIR